MKIVGITHNKELAVGFKMSGIEAEYLDKKEDILKSLEEIKKQKDVGILVITDTIYNMTKQEIEDIKKNAKLPLIVNIPN